MSVSKNRKIIIYQEIDFPPYGRGTVSDQTNAMIMTCRSNDRNQQSDAQYWIRKHNQLGSVERVLSRYRPRLEAVDSQWQWFSLRAHRKRLLKYLGIASISVFLGGYGLWKLFFQEADKR